MEKARKFIEHKNAPPPKWQSWLGTAFILATLCDLAFAQDGNLDKKTPNGYVNADYGYSTHKSNTVKGTDFGSELALGAGTWGGKSRQYGLSINQNTNFANFSQSDASMKTTWTDFRVNFRWYWFYPSLIIGSCNIHGKNDGETVVDLMCATMGGGLDFNIPLGEFAILHIDTLFVRPNVTKDRSESDATMGMRSDYGFGTIIRPKWDWVDVLTGFQYRIYSIDGAAGKKNEIQTGPYLGIRLNI